MQGGVIGDGESRKLRTLDILTKFALLPEESMGRVKLGGYKT